MKALIDFFDPYFQWWQSSTTRYLDLLKENSLLLSGFGFSLERYLDWKKGMDRSMEEMWRNLKLPPLEEITRLHERLNTLEHRLVSIQDGEVETLRGELGALKKLIEGVDHQMVRTQQFAAMEKAVAEIGLKLNGLDAASGKHVRKASANDSGSPS